MSAWGVLRAADPVGGDDAQARARRELARPEYRRDHHDGPGWLQRLLDWIGEQLAKLLDHVTGGGAGAHATLLIVLALLAGLVVFGVRAGRPERRRRTGAATDDPLAAVDARAHRLLAERFTADERYAEALREWLRAAVATIEERGILPARPGRTGATTALETAPVLPGAAGALTSAVRAFDEIWFGGRDARPDDAERGRAAADAVGRERPREPADSVAPAGLAAPW